MSLPSMEFSFSDAIYPIIIVAFLSGIQVPRDYAFLSSREPVTLRPLDFYVRALVFNGLIVVPMTMVVSAMSRADVNDETALWTRMAWGAVFTIAVWLVVLTMPALRRWLNVVPDRIRAAARRAAV